MKEKLKAFFSMLTKGVRLYDVAIVPVLIIVYGPLVLLAVAAVLIAVVVVRIIVRIAREKRRESRSPTPFDDEDKEARP